MPLINAKCTNCGGVLQVEQGKDAMVCPFCGSAFIVEKAVQNFNVTNNIRADVVNIYQGQKDFTVKGGILVKYNGESPVVTVPEGVLEIGKNAFKDCKYISSDKLPSSLVSIDQGAFYGCRQLKSIEIPEGTESIGDCAFAKCSELKSVQIPSSVKKLGYCAFYECVSLPKIVLPEGGEEIRSLAFYGCSKLADVTVPSSLNMLWNFVFHQCAPMDYRYAGTLAQLIILYARSSHFLSYNTDDVFDESIAKDLKKLFRFYDTCPEDFKDFDDGEFSDEFFGPGLDIPGLQNLYVGGALLQGTLYYPKEAAEFGGSIASCDLFEGYKKLKDVSLPKGYSRKNMACCILCGWPEKPSLFGKCKKCGAKYVTRKEEDQ